MKIYLAGMESVDLEDVISKGSIRNAFYSYFYLRGEKSTMMKNLIEGRKYIKNIIIDSGAHSFFAESDDASLTASNHKKDSKMKETPDVFHARYVEWVMKYHQYFDYFVELDIGEIVGQEKVMAWRDLWANLGLSHKLIMVYHPKVQSWDDFLKMLDDSRSRYVALEGERGGRRAVKYLSCIRECYKRKVRVHGFAMTKSHVYLNLPFTSVDSSSWKAPMRYGAGTFLTKDGAKNIRYNSKDIFKISDTKIPTAAFVGDNKRLQRQALLLNVVDYWNYLEDFTEEVWKKRNIIWSV